MKKVELNLIDKAVAFFNPNAAVERLASRAKLTKFEYDATMYNRQRRVPSQLTGAEGFRSNYDRVEMMKRARDLDQNFGLVRSLLLKFATHVAANITYQARTTDQNVNSDVEAYWNSWWDKCDLSGRHTGSILMQIATMSMLRDGDFFFVLARTQDGDLRLQGIEADRIGDPFRTYTSLNLIGGIHINQETGAPDGYDVYLRTFGNAYMFQATIPASQVFHLYDPLRIDQYRGVTAFCTAINDATDIYEITAMEKMAAKIASSQGGIIKRTNNNASDLANLTNDLDANNQTIKIESIEPGRITYLEPGEEMQFPDSPNRPGNGFQEFHKILLRNICMGVGIPYSFAVDPSAMSGPTARLEMQQASRTFKRHQKLLEDKVLRPVKNIVIADAVSRGLIKNNIGTKTTKGVFNFGANVSIDLGRESESAIAEFKSGLRTGSDIMAERGQDFESSIILKAQEAKKIADLAQQYDIPATSISDITESALFAQAQSRTQLNPDGSPATPEQGAQTTDGTPTPTGQEALIDYSLNGAQISSLIQIINAVAAGAITQEGANAIIRAAFPNIPDSVIQSIVAGINVGTLAPTGKVTAGEATQIPTPPPIDQTKPEKLGSNDVPEIKPQDTESGESGGDGDIDVGEEREPTEATPVEELPTGSTADRKLLPKVPSILETKKKEIETTLSSLSQDELKMLIAGMMGGIELGKYDDIDFTPPQGVRDAAKRGLEVRQKAPPSQRGGTAVGIARARDLSSGKSISPETARRMKAFFDRHEVDKKGSTWDEQGKGWQAWQLWGGDAGYSWAKKLVKQMNSRDEKKNLEEPNACPIATQDIKTNLENRQNAVDDANYGPANPNEPNEDYWKAKAGEFQGDVATAKKMLCGNCAAFNQTKKLLGCIKEGIGADAEEVAIGGDLGYCEIFDFKCAAKRTCDAWIVGGPITDKKKEEENLNCGTGAGGFQPGNTCATGSGDGGASDTPKERYRDRIEGTDEEVVVARKKTDRMFKSAQKYKDNANKHYKDADSAKAIADSAKEAQKSIEKYKAKYNSNKFDAQYEKAKKTEKEYREKEIEKTRAGNSEMNKYKEKLKTVVDRREKGFEADDKKKVETEFVAGRDCGQDEGGTFGSGNTCAVGYGRPADRGGYTPERPGGKMPKDYVRPTPQDKTEKPQAKAKEGKTKDILDSYKYDKNGEAEVPEKKHLDAIKHAYRAGDTYEKQKLDISEDEKGLVDNYRKQSGGAWSKYERALAEGESREEAFKRAMTGGLASPEGALRNLSGDTLTEKDIVTYKLYEQTKNEEGLKKFYSKVNDIADQKIKELNRLTNTKFDSEQTLYRGFRADGYESKNILNDIKSGKNLNFTSFMSASSDPDIASSYARREDEISSGNSILFKIKAKRGISTINSNNPSFESDLKETILPKGQYKVTKYRTVSTGKAKTHFVEIEQL